MVVTVVENGIHVIFQHIKLGIKIAKKKKKSNIYDFVQSIGLNTNMGMAVKG